MNKGFTLIELLVVILIIGVLSVVALPQYTEAVERSRAAEAMVNAKAIMDGVQRYKQLYPGKSVSGFANLADVQIRGISASIDGKEIWTKNFKYKLGKDTSNREKLTIIRYNVEGGQANPYTVTYTYTENGAVVTCNAGAENVSQQSYETQAVSRICNSFKNLSVEE